MNRKITLYLHFARSEKLNTWEIKFTNALSSIILQLFGEPANLLCNCDIPGTIFCNPHDSKQLLDSIAYIFIFNFSSHTDLKENEILQANNVMDLLFQQQKNNICIVNRYYRKKPFLAEKFGKQTTFNFFELNAKTQEVIDFKPDSKEDKDNNYWLKITDLAYSIKTFAEEETRDLSDINIRKHTIYLAEVSLDQIKTRDRLRRDLELSGFHIIPEKPLPKETTDFAKDVKYGLEQSILSINIMGELYGDGPIGSDYSYQELQNKYFTEVYNEQIKTNLQPIRRVIWSTPELEPYEEKQTQYLKRLKRELNITNNTDFIQSTLHELISLIEYKIANIIALPAENEVDKNKILVISDNYTDNNAILLQQEMDQRSIQYVLLNQISQTMDNDLEKIMLNIGQFKHNIILATKPENLWLTGILTILTRSRGYAKALPFGKTGLFYMGSIKKYPDLFPLIIEPYIINSVNLSQQLDSFISKIKA